jgi:transcriptional regulator with XRE-family HTH domain
MPGVMDASNALREARVRAGLTQAALAERAGTSQATVSAYEAGRKDPSVATLTIEPAADAVIEPSPAELARRGRELVAVLELAAALPTHHEPTMSFPPVKTLMERAA